MRFCTRFMDFLTILYMISVLLSIAERFFDNIISNKKIRANIRVDIDFLQKLCYNMGNSDWRYSS